MSRRPSPAPSLSFVVMRRGRAVARAVRYRSTGRCHDRAVRPAGSRGNAALLAHVRTTGTPSGAHDLIVAATARARERQVVSFDRRGFARLPDVSLAGLLD